MYVYLYHMYCVSSAVMYSLVAPDLEKRFHKTRVNGKDHCFLCVIYNLLIYTAFSTTVARFAVSVLKWV